MTRLSKCINILEAINNFNITILRIPLIPFFLIYLGFEEIYDNRQRKKRQKEEENDPKEQIRRKLKKGELRLCDMPHDPKLQGKDVPFQRLPNGAFYNAYQFYYVATQPDDRILRFLREEQEAIARWTEWYGFEIEVMDDQEQLLSTLLFPQDRVLFPHGLLRNPGCLTSEREYFQDCAPFRYFHLDADSPTPLIDQLYLIAQDALTRDR